MPIPASIISAGFISLITSVPTSIAKELIQGLKYDLPAKDASLRKLIPQKLISFDDAVRETLADEEAALDDQDWGYSPEVRNRWKPGYGYYPKMPDVQCQHQRVRRHFGMSFSKLVVNKVILW